MKMGAALDRGIDRLAPQPWWRKAVLRERDIEGRLANLASLLRIARLRLGNPDVRIGFDSRIGPGCVVLCGPGARITLHGVTLSRQVTLDASPGAVLDIAADFIGPGTIIAAKQAVTIGRHAQIADMVTIRDHNHRHGTDVPLGELQFDVRPVLIGDNVWLGSKATVTAGTTVGTDALVAAGAVVTRDVPPGLRVGGVPARPL
jgi:acetyltransferase-like isoleucine patch superfamily enzyme